MHIRREWQEIQERASRCEEDAALQLYLGWALLVHRLGVEGMTRQKGMLMTGALCSGTIMRASWGESIRGWTFGHPPGGSGAGNKDARLGAEHEWREVHQGTPYHLSLFEVR